MILSHDGDIPGPCAGGLAISPRQLSDEQKDAPMNSQTSFSSQKMTVSLSFATANVRTFYK